MSRDIADDKIDFEEALKRFEYIMAQKPYSLWVKTVAVAFCCGFFTLLFGGNAFDGLNSFVVEMCIRDRNCTLYYTCNIWCDLRVRFDGNGKNNGNKRR